MTLAPGSLAGAVIAFDLDGTLVDTAPDLIGALNSVLGENGLPALPLARARLMVGRGARALIEQGFAADGAPLDPQATPGLVAHFIEVYLARIADESRPFEGVEAALDELAAAGATLAVCTNKRTDLSRALLDALNMTWRFAAVIGADLAPAPKPDARHLLTAITAAGGRSARALMVGDSGSDIGAARAAAVPSVLVSFGYTEIPPADLGADVMIDRFDQLADVAARLLEADRLASSIGVHREPNPSIERAPPIPTLSQSRGKGLLPSRFSQAAEGLRSRLAPMPSLA